MREQHGIHAFEVAIANVIGLRAQQLFGDSRPYLDRPREMVLDHHILHRKRRNDVHRLPGVMAFAVSRRARNDGVVIRHARLLRGLRNAVEIGAQRDHRLARAPRRHPRRRYSRDAVLDLEAILLQQIGQVLRRLELLEAELAEAEHRVDHHLHELRVAVDMLQDLLFHICGLRIAQRRSLREGATSQQRGQDNGKHSLAHRSPRTQKLVGRKCLSRRLQQRSLTFYRGRGAHDALLRQRPILLLDRLAHRRQRLHAITRIEARRIDHVLEPRPMRQSSRIEQRALRLQQRIVDVRVRRGRVSRNARSYAAAAAVRSSEAWSSGAKFRYGGRGSVFGATDTFFGSAAAL